MKIDVPLSFLFLAFFWQTLVGLPLPLSSASASAVDAFVSSIHSSSPPPRWINMTTQELRGWYTDVDMCMLSLKPPGTRLVYYSEDYKQCLRLRKPQQDPLCEATILCQYAPTRLYQRPEGYGTDNVDIVNQQMESLFLHLNRTGRALFFFGDSITRNIITGLRCALQRANPNITFHPPLSATLKFGFTSTWVFIPQPHPLPTITSEIFFYALWTPTGRNSIICKT